MRHDLHEETGSRLGQLRDLERELAELHGYRRPPHGQGGSLDCIDPSTGERLTLGAVVSRLRREHRERGQVLARQERGHGHEQAGESCGGVHDATIALAAARVEVP